MCRDELCCGQYVVGVIMVVVLVFFVVKQKTAYEMRISDWSSDVCSSDLVRDEVEQLGQLFGLRGVVVGLAFDVDRQGRIGGQCVLEALERGRCVEQGQIGRASCRERVCQYV